jgi:hypothetical protein
MCGRRLPGAFRARQEEREEHSSGAQHVGLPDLLVLDAASAASAHDDALGNWVI